MAASETRLEMWVVFCLKSMFGGQGILGLAHGKVLVSPLVLYGRHREGICLDVRPAMQPTVDLQEYSTQCTFRRV